MKKEKEREKQIDTETFKATLQLKNHMLTILLPMMCVCLSVFWNVQTNLANRLILIRKLILDHKKETK